MSDSDFERRLERLFAQPPRMHDADLFAARVEKRLERGWGVRRLLVGVAGGVGGLVAASKLVDVEILRRFESVSLPEDTLPQLSLPQSWTGAGLESAAMGGEVLWMTAALLGLAMAFAAMRWAEGF